MRESLDRRLADLREAAAYRNYERIREWVLEVKSREIDEGSTTFTASQYWTEELETLDYLFDASPLVIEKLRHHAYTVTGLRAYDYRRGKEDAGEKFKVKLDALRSLAEMDLFVHESPLLGGFGHMIDGGLVNIDTLKYFEVLIAMERGGLLGMFGEDGAGRIVLEVGAGWGGFPYTVKTLFPKVTILIIDLPELFLYSGTYLQTAFPDAHILLHGRDDLTDPHAWEGADFVFVPNTALPEVAPPRLDLGLNMVSFQEMTGSQVEAYVRRIHEMGSPFLYSLNRERSHYNAELDSVSEIIGRWFWSHEIPMLPVNYMKMLRDAKKDVKRARLKSADATPDANEYRHIVGKRRIFT